MTGLAGVAGVAGVAVALAIAAAVVAAPTYLRSSGGRGEGAGGP